MTTDDNQAPEAVLLRQLYVDEGLTLEAIAARFGVSSETIRIRCIKYGIPLRPRGRAEIPLTEREASE